MKNQKRVTPWWAILITAVMATAGCGEADNSGASASAGSGKSVRLLNVSYDPTREFYTEFNEKFAAHWQKESGEAVTVEQSHGGAGKQARAVMDGLEADVLTLAIGYDIDVMAEKTELLQKNWQERFPNRSCPYTTTIVFLVRKGNPKGIKDWNDLIKPGVEVITPNPKTSGGARLNYLAAWGYALKQPGGDASKAREFVSALYKNVPVLDSGARGATTTFAQRGIGDVLLTWENEAFLAVNELGADQVEIVIPSLSILAEPPIAIVDANVKKHGTEKVAEAYLNYLYSAEGQNLAAKHFYRPIHAEHASPEDMARFPKVELFSVADLFGSWKAVQAEHFDDNGIFDQIYGK